MNKADTNDDRIKKLEKELADCKNKLDIQEDVINAFAKQRITDSIEFTNILNEYNKIINSTTWKKTEPIRMFLNKIKGITTSDLKAEEVKHRDSIYNQWINKVEDNISIYELNYKPLLSIIMPIYNVERFMLIEAIDSVINQLYSNWELILIDDVSNCRDLLDIYSDNPKIKIIKKDEHSGISATTNEGVRAATGAYIAFLDCDDVISLNALQEVAKVINNHRKVKIIYSDYDIMTSDSSFNSDPFFKPDFSPDLLSWNNYISHFVVYKKSFMDDIGEFNPAYDGSQDYDYVLRACEKAKRCEIYHIDKVLYHWRSRKESVSFSNSSKEYAISSAIDARQAFIDRNNLKGHLDCLNGIYRAIFDDLNTSASIIIPSKDNFGSLKSCIDSIISKTKYSNYEIIVVDNGSNNENKEIISNYLKEKNVKYIYFNKSFNYSYMCNIGVKEANNDVLVFMNDDIVIQDENWLSIMIGQAIQRYTGAVGIKLYYPNSNMIQHCGVGCYLGGPGHYLQGMLDNVDHYHCRNLANYNVLAVTAACMAVEKKKFIKVNGFDERLGLNYNDVDLCMRLYSEGYYNVVRNDVVATHFESKTRQPAAVQQLFADRELLYKKNNKYKNRDPFYNRNLPQFSSNFDYERDLKLYDFESGV